MPHLVPDDVGETEKTPHEGGLHQEMPAQLDVVQDGHAVEELHLLKGPGDS